MQPLSSPGESDSLPGRGQRPPDLASALLQTILSALIASAGRWEVTPSAYSPKPEVLAAYGTLRILSSVDGLSPGAGTPGMRATVENVGRQSEKNGCGCPPREQGVSNPTPEASADRVSHAHELPAFSQVTY